MAVLAVGASLAGGRFACQYWLVTKDNHTIRQICVSHGVIVLEEYRRATIAGDPVDTLWRWSVHAWSWQPWGEDSWEGIPTRWHVGVLYDRDHISTMAGVSLVWPALIAFLPAALLWYTDRRRFGPERCSKCGYDRRGLAINAKCPECGTVPAPIK